MAFQLSGSYDSSDDALAFVSCDGIICGSLREEYLKNCNPIETKFFDGLASFELYEPYFDIPFIFSYKKMYCELTPQYPIEGTRYRADFVLMASLSDPSQGIEIVIEIDGHNFHEKNKYQVAKDKKRERKIQALGYPVVRFSGSEVYSHSSECWEEVFEIAHQYLYGIMGEKH